MKNFALSLFVSSCLTAQVPVNYPETRKMDVKDDYFGVQVPDPYRWLEDDNSAETKAWVEAQNRTSFGYLAQIPERERIKGRLTRLWNFEKFSAPSRKGKRYFYSHNTGLQNQFVLFVTEDLQQPGRVLLDPNTLSKDGTVALSGTSISENGRYLAYAISVAGSDWQTWKVRDIDTGKDLADEIQWSKFSGAAWTKDATGFFYSRYDAPKEGDAMKGVNKFQKVFFHRIGTAQSQDELVYERKDQPDWGLGASVTDDGRWLLISQSEGTERKNRLFLKDLAKPGSAIEPFLDRFDASYHVVDNQGETFFVQTDQGAPRHRLVAIRKGHTDPKQWKELIAEGKNKDVLQNVNLVGERFVAFWMRDAHTAITFHDLKGRFQKELTLPALGTAGGFGGKRKDMEAFYTFASFTYPSTIYRYDFATGKSQVHKTPKVDFDPARYEVKQVFYPSKDGTKVPMFLVHKKGLQLDGQNPTLLYGYGGFNASMTPSFSPTRLVWLEMGGVYAVANLRGGSEYGKDWWAAGKREKKQNVFDDFIAAGEWLIANKYTSTPKLAINGASNGGLLVGACMTQRPELFGAAIPEVGVMDMLRYHKFTIGWAWKSDYMSSETKEGFANLMTYSPLHTLKPGVKYPATLVTTGDHDDRVVPAHSFKFAAALQAAHAGEAPVLIRIETSAGHGAGKPTAKIIQERADVWTFLVKNLGMTLPADFK
jgi:prolyl oligopeptidase